MNYPLFIRMFLAGCLSFTLSACVPKDQNNQTDPDTASSVRISSSELCITDQGELCKPYVNQILLVERTGEGPNIKVQNAQAPYPRQRPAMSDHGLAIVPISEVDFRLTQDKLAVVSTNPQQLDSVLFKFSPQHPLIFHGNKQGQILIMAESAISTTTFDITGESVIVRNEFQEEIVTEIGREDPTTFWVGLCDDPEELMVKPGIGEMVIIDTEIIHGGDRHVLDLHEEDYMRAFDIPKRLLPEGEGGGGGISGRSAKRMDGEFESCMPPEGEEDCILQLVPEGNWSIATSVSAEEAEIIVRGKNELQVYVAGELVLAVDLREYTVGFTIDGEELLICLGERN